MRNSLVVAGESKNIRRLVTLAALLCAVVSLPLLSRATTMATSITVVNNSSREVHHIYLSPADQDNWGPDQLNGSVISSSASYTLSGVACSGASIKVISEDQNGCFLSSIVSCSESAVWTITNEATPDCGN